MSQSEERDLLIALSLLPFLTPNRTRLLREHFEPLSATCNAPSTLLQALLRVTPAQAGIVRNPLTKPMRERVAALRDTVVTLADDAYPAALREIVDPPLALHFRGDLSLLQRPALAIVGSRRASPYAINATEHLTRQLVPAGLAIVSGFALGVDTAAHQATLDAGGATIAVLGTGIDVVYPPKNLPLFGRIVERGLVLTEFAPGAPPKKEHFPIRNRVIAGLSAGAVIVEASRRSGSLITARMAAEQGREVFAVPGSIFSDGSEGTHRLIQSGAKLVHDAADILDELPVHVRQQLSVAMPAPAEPEPGSPLAEVLAMFTREEGAHIDTVASRLGRTAGSIAEALLELELGGWIRALPGARFVRVK
jgi:DNA processing protein